MTLYNIQSDPEEKDRADIKKDTVVQQLVNARPAQINNWIDNNVTDLNSAKTVLKLILRIIVALMRRELR